MAFKFPGLKAFAAVDAKSRMFLLFAVVVAISLGTYLVIHFFGGTVNTGAANLAAPPKSLVSVPGGDTSPEYQDAVIASNEQRTQTAQARGAGAGASAIQTILNNPNAMNDNGCYMCPSDDNPNIENEIQTLLDRGKISSEQAAALKRLTASNVSVEEYAAALDELVRAGKLTPEEARLLLEKYKKQHSNAAIAESAKSMDALIKSGKVPLTVATELLELQKRRLTPAEYAAELQRLVREGKISPDTAAELLAQYTRQVANEAAKMGAFNIDKMAKNGEITPDVAKKLKELQQSNIPLDQYAAEIDRLVIQGKMTPAVAAKLIQQYRAQKVTGSAPAPLLQEVQQAKARANQGLTQLMQEGIDEINDFGKSSLREMVGSGQLSADVANTLENLQNQNVSPEEYEAMLKRLVAEGKISPELAAKLAAQYRASKQLKALQAQNVSPEAYRAALDKLVSEGKLTPEQAAQLAARYQDSKQLKDMQAQNATPDAYRAALNKLVAEGKISADTAKKMASQYETARQLANLQASNVPEAEYKNALDTLVRQGKITPEKAAQLAAEYNALHSAINATGPLGALVAKGGPATDLANRLITLQANNASTADYTDELKRAVQAGIISPEEAEALLKQYQAALAAPAAGLSPGAETIIPTAEFAQLQQQVQAGARPSTTSTTTNTFSNVKVQNQKASNEDRIKEIQRLRDSMAKQAQNLVNNVWQPPKMEHKEGSPPNANQGIPGSYGSVAGGFGDRNTLEDELKKPALIKAGVIQFAILETAIDSDYPDTPVMATIIEGKFKGAKLLGKLNLAKGQDKVSLNFTLMDMDGWPSAKTISAFAIDPDTARTVMASEVNHHYMQRYGLIMATSFLQGYSTAITNEGESTTGVFGTSTSHPELSPGNRFAVGLGQIGTNLNSLAAENINRPATVKINAGVGLGILYSSEVKDEDTPILVEKERVVTSGIHSTPPPVAAPPPVATTTTTTVATTK